MTLLEMPDVLPAGVQVETEDGGYRARVVRGGGTVVTVAFPPVEATAFARNTGVDPERLVHAFVLDHITVESDRAAPGDLALAVFVAMRRQRLEGRSHYVTYLEGDASELATLLRPARIRDAAPRTRKGPDGASHHEVAVHGRIDEATLRCFEAMTEAQRDQVRGEGFVEEVRAEVMAGVARFVKSPFFEAARAGTLSWSQYVHSTANNHQFMRYTTRMLGLAVAACDDPVVRAHFAEHLSGEVNHEVWLEQDLAYLEADVDYVKRLMVPDAPIMQFNFIQEALTSFRRDPIVFMGVPIAIEGASAHMPMEAIEALRSCIRSWGYDRPKLGTRFLSSHIRTDGGHGSEHEGHWEGTLRMIRDHVRTERQQQQILRIVRLVFQSLESAYAGYVAHPAL